MVIIKMRRPVTVNKIIRERLAMYAWGWVIVVIFAMDYYQNQLNNLLLLSAIWGVTFVLVEFCNFFGLPHHPAAALPAVAGSLMYDVVYSYHNIDWTRAVIIFVVAYSYYFFSYRHFYSLRYFYFRRKKQR
jgi:hypothetical protein